MIRKRSVTIRGHRTSISLEDEFWQALKAIATARGISLAALIADIDENRRPDANLSSAMRLCVLDWLRSGNTL
ncbi:ribbon-helix-helix domain-containing protein [Nitratireductor sp. XY-223]|uniref:ribbon-helix-helix domain-containing protein n=1 Tax=Nitratireductor sp. XY-223 TaxID=2561926 RepID=UPI0010AAAF97|nr:ribbon-helix-helix domain-containing protein [Nitratireductor sp. XY-223]